MAMTTGARPVPAVNDGASSAPPANKHAGVYLLPASEEKPPTRIFLSQNWSLMGGLEGRAQANDPQMKVPGAVTPDRKQNPDWSSAGPTGSRSSL